MSNPENLGYTTDHEWVDLADPAAATVGVTKYAADALGDVVYVQLPEVGATLTTGEACGEIESTKSVSDLFAPADGVVVEINEAVVDTPELVNTDPFGDGWLFRVRVDGEPELLDAAAYAEHTKED
ncbi:glycine cleavage system protein GcvH [Actinokineospora globicatena]|uniref:Glycine cleavage system H protein n=1 Tax=Actinokineospora globicatena TaxID=103729 RepID=A0A9W6QGV2_9PSEU|nr:glycine cleavage system protein GcvH [Actinokineospora globicatena]MCP2304458.1 glycine cleavage system H protein [Actinokineospora globicatena]GLW78176.1 glycine cleavage system H protein [Actinokineospora globicatena]GLW85158.1 glycine cleavage system H protein [Actinokineospora globicatena]GLW90781.1 glycine cleavage system H protein [Actinokineospora globicatena]